MFRRSVLLMLGALAACGPDELRAHDAAEPAPPDAASDDAALDLADAQPVVDGATLDAAALDANVDAPGPLIALVPCAGATIVATVETGASSYAPAQVTLAIGEIVRFAPTNPHDVRSGTPSAPEHWFQIDGNDPRCLRFDELGTFPFFCQVHPNMAGQVVVRALDFAR